MNQTAPLHTTTAIVTQPPDTGNGVYTGGRSGATIEPTQALTPVGTTEAAPADVKLSVNSTPAGARIWVNGTAHGITPQSLTRHPGAVLVRLEKEGYELHEEEIQVSGNTVVSYALVPLVTVSTAVITSLQANTTTPIQEVLSAGTSPVPQPTTAGSPFVTVAVSIVGAACGVGLLSRRRDRGE